MPFASPAQFGELTSVAANKFELVMDLKTGKGAGPTISRKLPGGGEVTNDVAIGTSQTPVFAQARQSSSSSADVCSNDSRKNRISVTASTSPIWVARDARGRFSLSGRCTKAAVRLAAGRRRFDTRILFMNDVEHITNLLEKALIERVHFILRETGHFVSLEDAQNIFLRVAIRAVKRASS